jgi:hypothetical protein
MLALARLRHLKKVDAVSLAYFDAGVCVVDAVGDIVSIAKQLARPTDGCVAPSDLRNQPACSDYRQWSFIEHDWQTGMAASRNRKRSSMAYMVRDTLRMAPLVFADAFDF